MLSKQKFLQVFQESRPSYRSEIDGLRAIAVLAVLINHLNPQLLKGGFLGVDIFFVISGFIITYTMSRSASSQSPGSFIKNFYQKRIRRIIPALAVYVVASFVVYSLFVSSTGDVSQSAIASLLGLSNLYFWKTAETGYFGAQLELNPFTNTWSLGVEEQFYIVYPLFFVLTRKISSRVLALAYALLGALSFFFFLTVDQDSSFFLPWARAWELFAGVLTFYVCKFKNLVLNEKCLSIRKSSVLGLLCLFVICLLLVSTTSYNPISTALVVLATSLFLWRQQVDDCKKLLSSKILLWIGTRSYSIYLWHWSLIVVAKWTLGLTLLTGIFVVLLTVLISEASYRYIEQPFRHRVFRQSNQITNSILALTPLNLSFLLLAYQLFIPSSMFLGKSPLLRREFDKNSHLKDGKIKVLVIGESHANHLGGLVTQLNSRYGYDAIIHSYSQVNFPLSDHLPKTPLDNANLRKLGFYAKNRNLQASLESLSEGDFLIVSERGGLNFESPGLESALAKILNRGINIVFIEPLLYFSDEYNAFDLWKPEACVEDWFRPTINSEKCNSKYVSSLDRSEVVGGYLGDQTRMLRKFVSDLPVNNPSVAITFNANDIICSVDQLVCRSTSAEGLQVWRDDDHLTFEGSKLLAGDMSKLLLEITNSRITTSE